MGGCACGCASVIGLCMGGCAAAQTAGDTSATPPRHSCERARCCASRRRRNPRDVRARARRCASRRRRNPRDTPARARCCASGRRRNIRDTPVARARTLLCRRATRPRHPRDTPVRARAAVQACPCCHDCHSRHYSRCAKEHGDAVNPKACTNRDLAWIERLMRVSIKLFFLSFHLGMRCEAGSPEALTSS